MTARCRRDAGQVQAFRTEREPAGWSVSKRASYLRSPIEKLERLCDGEGVAGSATGLGEAGERLAGGLDHVGRGRVAKLREQLLIGFREQLQGAIQ